MRLSGSVKFFCALGSGLSDGGAAGRPGFLRPSACRRSSAFSCASALAAAAAFASASSSAFAARIFSARFFLFGHPVGQLLAALIRAEGFVFLGVRRLGGAQPPLNLGLELRRPLLHAIVAHRLVLGGVRLDLRAVERDMAELDQPRLLAKLENLREQAGERLQMALAEVGDGAKIRRFEPDKAHEVDPLARRLGDPARRVDAVAIAVQQERVIIAGSNGGCPRSLA